MDSLGTTPPLPSLTKTWHRTSYPAISPARPELSAKGKTVLITGGGTGIGAATALSFAAAGATHIAILARRVDKLNETKSIVESKFPQTSVLPLICDIVSADAVNVAFAKAVSIFKSPIDICISGSAFLSTTSPISESDPTDFWNAFETNVRGSFNVIRAFLANRRKGGSHLINISTAIVHFPALPLGLSGYATSKAGATKLFDYAQAENPDVFVLNLQPGVVHSEINVKSAIPAQDDAALPGDFMVWAVSPEANFLKGKFVYANWDVDELKTMKENFLGGETAMITLNGVDFTGWDPTKLSE